MLPQTPQADIHIENREIMALLLSLFSSKVYVTNITGILSQGNITSTNFQGPMMGKQLSNLMDLMQKGGAYVNVLTVQNPNGEIRGQLGFAGIDQPSTNVGQQKVNMQQTNATNLFLCIIGDMK